MELFDLGISTLLFTLLAILMGTFIGLIAGAIPGIGPMVAIVILLPITYTMEPLAAILLLLATYQSAEYGGSISSVTLGIPGTAAAAATVLDGTPMGKKHPGKALGYSLVASTIGGLFGALVLILLAKPMTSFALELSAPEFFLLGILGLVGVGAISSSDPSKSMISVILGLMAATIGTDSFTSVERFTGGLLELSNGLSIIAVILGVFAISQILDMVDKNLNKKQMIDSASAKAKVSLREIKGVSKSIGIGSTFGTIMGIIPGIGPGAASWFSYATAKKVSKTPHLFGKGSPEGIAAPESANNSSVGGALLPLLTLGIPGSAATAVILGAFTIHGIQPGPQVLTSEPTLTYGIFVGFFITTIVMYFVGRILTPWFARVLSIPTSILIPIILGLSILGVYAADSTYFNVWIALLFGIIAYFLIKLEFSVPSFVLAFILCPIIETNLRRSLVMSDGSLSIFVSRMHSIIILLIILAIIIGAVVLEFGKKKKKRDEENTFSA